VTKESSAEVRQKERSLNGPTTPLDELMFGFALFIIKLLIQLMLILIRSPTDRHEAENKCHRWQQWKVFLISIVYPQTIIII
jgi:hypothetical protein